ncbi:DUF4153 domain-containing protein [Bacillus sp. AK031]
MKKKNKVLIVCCIIMGMIANWLFIDHSLGVSVLLFVTFYYCLFYWQIRGRVVSNRKIGFLLMLSVLALSLSYFLYWNIVFYLLNLIVLPALIIIHSVLITRKATTAWNSPRFIVFMFSLLGHWISFAAGRLSLVKNIFQRKVATGTYRTLKLVIIGLAISVPLVMFTGLLLISADNHFADLIGKLPVKVSNLHLGDEFFRFVFILLVSLALYSFLKVIINKNESLWEEAKGPRMKWESIIVLTVLFSLNALYALFTVVQFQYFFSGSLASGFTYADYARRGFFELVVVTLFNWSIVVAVIKTAADESTAVKSVKNILLTLLIVMSGIMLYSAFMRLHLYEEAYGFTLSRILAHAAMGLIGVILSFTLLKIWYDRLSLSRFYIITFLLFYSALNIIDLNGWIVDSNIQRFQETGKIDLHYFEQMSYPGTLGLIELYKKDPDIPGLREVLEREMNEAQYWEISWQSSNLDKKRAFEALEELDFH